MNGVRWISLPLILALLCGCAAPPAEEPQEEPSCSAIAQEMLYALGRDPMALERLDDTLGTEGLPGYLTDFYGLPAESWEDCAIYRADGVEVFEVAVLRLTPEADEEAVLAGLADYIAARQGDFTGYAPEQAAIAAQARAVVQGRYAALLLCEDANVMREAFSACLEGGALSVEPEAGEEPVLQPEEGTALPEAEAPAEPPLEPESPLTAEPPSEPEPPLEPELPEEPVQPPQTPSPASPMETVPVTHPARFPYTPPEMEDMTLYDTAAILTAWRSGDAAGLSEKDRTILTLAEQALSEILTADMSEYERERAVYAWITGHVIYDMDHYNPLVQVDRDSYTPYGPLQNGKGVCLGFASLFQLLMDMAEVECITVTGAAFHSREDHAWNMVRLDGRWYCVDTTWDAETTERDWLYFNVSSDYMALTGHQWNYESVPETG